LLKILLQLNNTIPFDKTSYFYVRPKLMKANFTYCTKPKIKTEK